MTKKPSTTRTSNPPRQKLPITEVEVEFCHLLFKGDGNPKQNQQERIDWAGAKLGLTATEAKRMHGRKQVQDYIAGYRKTFLIAMAKEEARKVVSKGITREAVCARLMELAEVPPEKTRGSISGQVAALEAVRDTMGWAIAPRDPDKFFEGWTPEEMDHFSRTGMRWPTRPESVN